MPKKTKRVLIGARGKSALIGARGRGKAAKVDSVFAVAASAAVARADISSITTVLSAEILAYVLCYYEGGTYSVALLSKGCVTLKVWQASVQLALANERWRAPYVAAGRVFMLKLPEFLKNQV